MNDNLKHFLTIAAMVKCKKKYIAVKILSDLKNIDIEKEYSLILEKKSKCSALKRDIIKYVVENVGAVNA